MDETQNFNAPCEMGLSKTFSYRSSNVRMKKVNGTVFVCLTDMAKGFPSKNLTNIINSKEMTDYLQTLSRLQICSLADLLQVKNGGDGSQGTWAHRKIALRVAQKLSPDFAIWVDDRIEELLTYGMTATQPTLDEMVDNPDLVIKLATQLKHEREEKARLEAENAVKSKAIEEAQPSIVFTQAVSGSVSSCLVGELAKLIDQNGYPMGERRLFRWLRDNGFLGTKGERYNIPNQRYIEKGFFELKKGTRSGNNGVMHTTVTTKVTGKGQVYFINLFAKKSGKEAAIWNR